ncbi:MAG TPA: hypothetical protein VFA85_09305 [Terriglobales bacterium]|nr:hypothetical protein [Terriglobales bacterium]
MKTRLASPTALAVAALLCLALRPDSALAEPQSGNEGTPEAILDELVSTPDFGIVYIADGAGDGTILNGKPAPAVRKIVNLHEAAIPLLIRHLDDTRLTSAKYKVGKHWAAPMAVPVGYLCLDILSQIVKDNKVLFVDGQRDCDYDGMGACFRPKYSRKGARLVAGGIVLAVKQNWMAARQAGLLKFRFPSWLDRFSAEYSINP